MVMIVQVTSKLKTHGNTRDFADTMCFVQVIRKLERRNMAEELEKTCENCKYDYESMEGEHCRHCIHNAEERFEPKEKTADELEDELKFLRQWKSDVMEGFCKYDASSVEEIATHARNKAIDELAKSLKRDYVNFDMLYILQNNDFLTGNKSLRSYKNMIDELAEELKGGGK